MSRIEFQSYPHIPPGRSELRSRAPFGIPVQKTKDIPHSTAFWVIAPKMHSQFLSHILNTRLTLNLQGASCLCLWDTGIIGVHLCRRTGILSYGTNLIRFLQDYAPRAEWISNMIIQLLILLVAKATNSPNISTDRLFQIW